MDEAEVQQAAERYAKMEENLQALRRQNEELMRALGEQQDLVAAERLRADRCARAQMQEFANLTAELLAGREGPAVQFEGMRMNVKVEKPEQYDGDKARDLDTWLFQVREHLELVNRTSKRTRSVRRVFVTRKCSFVVEGGLRSESATCNVG